MAVEFLSAAALYRHLVEHANAKPIVLADDPWSEAEGSWWQLSREEAAARFMTEGQKTTQPEIHLRADKTVPYGAVAETLADAAKAGLSKIGFVTEPAQAP